VADTDKNTLAYCALSLIATVKIFVTHNLHLFGFEVGAVSRDTDSRISS